MPSYPKRPDLARMVADLTRRVTALESLVSARIPVPAPAALAATQVTQPDDDNPEDPQ